MFAYSIIAAIYVVYSIIAAIWCLLKSGETQLNSISFKFLMISKGFTDHRKTGRVDWVLIRPMYRS